MTYNLVWECTRQCGVDGLVAAYHLGHGGLGVVDSATGRPAARARPAGSRSVAEMRRLFWRLGLATQQHVERMLAWSMWRCWHQGMAKYRHDKRRSMS